MPVTPSAVAQAILAAGPDLRGPTWGQLAVVVGIAVAAWCRIPTNLVLQGITAGAAGGGAVVGKMAVIPTPLPVPASMALAGLLGLDASPVGRAIGLGIAAAFNASATYQGVSVGVGIGTDISKVTLSNGPGLVAALGLAASTSGLAGVNVPRVVAGLGPGIAALLLTGTGVGVVAGPVGPVPGAGTSISRVF